MWPQSHSWLPSTMSARMPSDLAKNLLFGQSRYRKFSGVSGWRAILTLQRHFSALTKFAHGESRFCGRKRQEKAVFYVPINLGSTKHVCRNVVVGVKNLLIFLDEICQSTRCCPSKRHWFRLMSDAHEHNISGRYGCRESRSSREEYPCHLGGDV
jgi:hypothetical protein